MSKYYTPNLDEFHKGFEYEVFQKGQPYEPNTMYLVPPETEDKWYKFKYPDPFLGYNLDRIFKSYTIRVKHIDEQDCLDLGLKTKVWYNGGGYFEKGDFTIGINSVGHFCTISQNDEGNNIIRFSGNLKNKSELRRILKQINIDE